MMYYNHLIILLFLSFICNVIYGQRGVTLKKIDSLTSLRQYDKASGQIDIYLNYNPGGKETLLKAARIKFEAHELPASVSYYRKYLNAVKKPKPQVIFELAQVYHHLEKFETAVEWYKKFLAEAGETHINYGAALLAVRHSSSGIKMKYGKKLGFVESLEGDINTSFNEIRPVFSPNYDGRMYFSSDRPLAAPVVEPPTASKKTSMSILRAVSNNNYWKEVALMNPLLETDKMEYLFDFVDRGRVVVFFRGENVVMGRILTDTFGTGTLPSSAPYPLKAEQGDTDLYFFTDSFLLFSSNREDGYGGYDLYYVIKDKDSWSQPVNLGSIVNSPYDEHAPFLSRDGRTLFFSSNRPSSTGGFDIFQTGFRDKEKAFSTPINLGLPVNSPGNEMFFRLSVDGFTGIYSSDRYDKGKGGMDLYHIFFNQKFISQDIASYPEHFGYLDAGEEKTTSPAPPQEKQQIILQPLFLQDNTALHPVNINSLNRVADALQTFPHGYITLISHSNYKGPLHLDLYFSYKHAAEVRDYLLTKNIEENRIIMEAFGNQLRMFNESDPYNARIHIEPGGFDPEFVEFIQDKTPLNRSQTINTELPDMSEPFYTINMLSTNSMFSGDVLEKVPLPYIRSKREGELTYNSGIFKELKEAVRAFEMIREYVPSALIRVNYKGKIIEDQKFLKDLSEKYIYLEEFLKWNK